MTNPIARGVLAATVLAGGLLLSFDKAEAQLINVESKYRIVEVDRGEQRIGVALPEADPKERQTWIYIKPDTKSSMREYLGGGAFRDEILSTNGIFNAAEARVGNVFKINGGRDFDGSIDAKKVWY